MPICTNCDREMLEADSCIERFSIFKNGLLYNKICERLAQVMSREEQGAEVENQEATDAMWEEILNSSEVRLGHLLYDAVRFYALLTSDPSDTPADIHNRTVSLILQDLLQNPEEMYCFDDREVVN